MLYNHVGITGPTRLDFDADAWDECMRINVWVPTAVTQRLVPLLRRSRSASIIFTSSQAGIAGTAALPVYAASKGAVIQFMKSVALLLAPDGIRANAICPGLTNTAGMRSAFQDGLIEETLSRLRQNGAARAGSRASRTWRPSPCSWPRTPRST